MPSFGNLDIFLIQPSFMKVITQWANCHRIAARLVIALLHIFIICCALLLRPLFESLGITLDVASILIIAITGMVLSVIAGIVCGSVYNGARRFRIHKVRYMLTGLCCALLVTGFLAGHPPVNGFAGIRLHGAFTPAQSRIAKPAFDSYSDKNLFYKDLKSYYSTLSRKELYRELRMTIKESSRPIDDNNGNKVVFMILIILGMVAATFGVAGLACTLACNGSDALAVLLLLGGLGLTAFLGIYFINKVFKRKEKQEPVVGQ